MVEDGASIQSMGKYGYGSGHCMDMEDDEAGESQEGYNVIFKYGSVVVEKGTRCDQIKNICMVEDGTREWLTIKHKHLRGRDMNEVNRQRNVISGRIWVW